MLPIWKNDPSAAARHRHGTHSKLAKQTRHALAAVYGGDRSGKQTRNGQHLELLTLALRYRDGVRQDDGRDGGRGEPFDRRAAEDGVNGRRLDRRRPFLERE